MKIGEKVVLNSGGKQIADGTFYIAAETLPTGYADITSVLAFANIGPFIGKDYKWVRKQLQSFSWESLNSVKDKTTIAKYKATSEENCKSVLSHSEYVHWMSDFDLRSQDCRRTRLANAKSILFSEIDLNIRYQILGFLNSVPTLISNYLDHGIEGTSDGDPLPGLFNYIEATGAFASSGIAAMNLTMSNGLTKQEMVTAMMDCLRNGEY